MKGSQQIIWWWIKWALLIVGLTCGIFAWLLLTRNLPKDGNGYRYEYFDRKIMKVKDFNF